MVNQCAIDFDVVDIRHRFPNGGEYTVTFAVNNSQGLIRGPAEAVQGGRPPGALSVSCELRGRAGRKAASRTQREL